MELKWRWRFSRDLGAMVCQPKWQVGRCNGAHRGNKKSVFAMLRKPDLEKCCDSEIRSNLEKCWDSEIRSDLEKCWDSEAESGKY